MSQDITNNNINNYKVINIHLDNLHQEKVTKIVSDSLKCSVDDTESLSKVIWKTKTKITQSFFKIKKSQTNQKTSNQQGIGSARITTTTKTVISTK